MSKYRKKQKQTIATFSRSRANFNTQVAEPEIQNSQEEHHDEPEEEELSPEEENEGLNILADLVAEGDEEGIEALLSAVEESLIAQIEDGTLSEEEAEDFLAEQEDVIAYLEECFLEELDSEEVPIEAEYDEEGEVSEDEEALIEEEGLALLEELEPEQVEEVYNATVEELEADLDYIEALHEAGEIDDEELEEAYAEAEEIHEENTQDFEAYLAYVFGDEEGEYEGEYESEYDEEGEYDEEDPLVDHIEALTEEVAFQRRQHAQIQAEFSRAQTANDVADFLDELERTASDLVQEGIMPYAIFQREFGEWESESDRMAGFSQVCSANGTSPEIELAQKERTIEMFLEMAESGLPLYTPQNYSHMAEFSEDEQAEIDNVKAQSRRNVRHLLGMS